MIKAVADIKPQWFSNVMNKFLHAGVFPDEWKIAELAVIPKPGKDDSEITYRPLGILNAVSKMIEHLIANRLKKTCGNARIIIGKPI